MTLAVAANHSLAQLKLLAQANNRIQARQALVDIQVVYAGSAGCSMSEKGPRVMSQIKKVFEKQAQG